MVDEKDTERHGDRAGETETPRVSEDKQAGGKEEGEELERRYVGVADDQLFLWPNLPLSRRLSNGKSAAAVMRQ